MKYITLSLSYCNGEHNMIMEMSSLGWGLINKVNPDYPTGQVNAYYTFAGGKYAKDVEGCDYRGEVRIKQDPYPELINTNEPITKRD